MIDDPPRRLRPRLRLREVMTAIVLAALIAAVFVQSRKIATLEARARTANAGLVSLGNLLAKSQMHFNQQAAQLRDEIQRLKGPDVEPKPSE